MSVADVLAALPDDTPISITVGSGSLTVGELRRALRGPRADRVLSTGQAAAEFGYSLDSWRKWADAGMIEGAWQDADGGPWRLPYASCERRVAELRGGAKRPRRRGRPWKRRTS